MYPVQFCNQFWNCPFVNPVYYADPGIQSNTRFYKVVPLNKQKDRTFPSETEAKNYCNFCRTNKEPMIIWKGHTLKNEHGEITCPVLFAHTCEQCGATGKEAHTIRYCPLTSTSEQGTNGTSTYVFCHNSIGKKGLIRK